MALILERDWVWDSWYVHDGARWHGFFLKAPADLPDPDLRHIHVSIGHATSADLRGWHDLGTCFTPAQTPAWDDYTTWTGSVLRGDDGRWHLFYTGTSRAESGLIQRIGHAVSGDLHQWQRVGSGPCLDLTGPGAEAYEVAHDPAVWHDRALRDPWVMRDPEGDGWLMFFTARAAGIAEAKAAGAIGLATSPDLHSWTLAPPVFTGGFGELEVPQIFARGGRWYGLFCTFARDFSEAQAAAHPGGPVTGTHYLIADAPRGPWQIAPGPFLDATGRYAARMVDTSEGPALIGFAERCTDGRFGGYLTDPTPLRFAPTGEMRLARLPSLPPRARLLSPRSP